MKLQYKIWSPHLWFSLITLSFSIPNNPSDLLKKQYFAYINNLPTFYPYDKFNEHFEKLLVKYPVTPYLDNKNTFLKWIHFIKEKTDIIYGYKPITMRQFLSEYYNHYTNESKLRRDLKLAKYCIVLLIIILFIFIINKYIDY
jgi:hypothetical protein